MRVKTQTLSKLEPLDSCSTTIFKVFGGLVHFILAVQRVVGLGFEVESSMVSVVGVVVGRSVCAALSIPF